MGEQLIQVSNITKKFGSKIILSNASITIEAGQSISLIGMNGSGKSTFLKILCGLSKIDKGEVTHTRKLRFNYIPEHFSKLNITAKKYIAHIGEIEGLTKNEVVSKSKELFQAFFLEDMIDIPMKFLSKGTLQKVGVVQAFMTDPDILLLDEPLSGQDLESQNVFVSMAQELNKSGITIVMSCHERMLIESLSSTAYKIENKRFVPLAIEEVPRRNNDILIFSNKSHDKIRNEEILKLAKEIEYQKGHILLIVPRDSSNIVITKALEEGFLLRGMYNE